MDLRAWFDRLTAKKIEGMLGELRILQEAQQGRARSDRQRPPHGADLALSKMVVFDSRECGLRRSTDWL